MSKYMTDDEKAAIREAKKKNRDFIDNVVVPRIKKGKEAAAQERK